MEFEENLTVSPASVASQGIQFQQFQAFQKAIVQKAIAIPFKHFKGNQEVEACAGRNPFCKTGMFGRALDSINGIFGLDLGETPSLFLGFRNPILIEKTIAEGNTGGPQAHLVLQVRPTGTENFQDGFACFSLFLGMQAFQSSSTEGRSVGMNHQSAGQLQE